MLTHHFCPLSKPVNPFGDEEVATTYVAAKIGNIHHKERKRGWILDILFIPERNTGDYTNFVFSEYNEGNQQTLKITSIYYGRKNH